MALIGMAIYSTEENNKDEYLSKTLDSLFETVDWSRHRIGFSINAYTSNTKILLKEFSERTIDFGRTTPIFQVFNSENIGTAEAINKVWQNRQPGEPACKMDDDVVIHQNDWLNQLEEAIARDPEIGQCGLKRKDCWEHPAYPDLHYRSILYQLPHEAGQKWIVGESVQHVMGTCVLHSSALLDKVGYLYQIEGNKYGFDDSFMSLRSKLAGFKNVFLPHIEIDHIDPGETEYQKWKEKNAWMYLSGQNGNPSIYGVIKDEFVTGKRSLYYNPFTK